MIKGKKVLKEQKYASPRTESVEITNQGVLCGSASGGLGFRNLNEANF